MNRRSPAAPAPRQGLSNVNTTSIQCPALRDSLNVNRQQQESRENVQIGGIMYQKTKIVRVLTETELAYRPVSTGCSRGSSQHVPAPSPVANGAVNDKENDGKAKKPAKTGNQQCENTRTRTSPLAQKKIRMANALKEDEERHFPQVRVAAAATIKALGLADDAASTDESRRIQRQGRPRLARVYTDTAFFQSPQHKRHFRRVVERVQQQLAARMPVYYTKSANIATTSLPNDDDSDDDSDDGNDGDDSDDDGDDSDNDADAPAASAVPDEPNLSHADRAAVRWEIIQTTCKRANYDGKRGRPPLIPVHDIPAVINYIKAAHAAMQQLDSAQVQALLTAYVGSPVSASAAKSFMRTVPHEFKCTGIRSAKVTEALRTTSLTASSLSTFFERADFQCAIDEFVLGLADGKACQYCKKPAKLACRDCGLRCAACASATHHPDNPETASHEAWVGPRSVDVVLDVCYDETSGTHSTKKHGGRPKRVYIPRDAMTLGSRPLHATTSPTTFVEFVVLQRKLTPDGQHIVAEAMDIDAVPPYVIVATQSVNAEIKERWARGEIELGSVPDTAHVNAAELANVHAHLQRRIGILTAGRRAFVHVHIDGPECHKNISMLNEAVANNMLYRYCVANATSCLQVCDDEAVFGLIKTEYHTILERADASTITSAKQIEAYVQARRKATREHRLRAWYRVGIYATGDKTLAELQQRRTEIARRHADQNDVTPTGVAAVTALVASAPSPNSERLLNMLTDWCAETRQRRQEAAEAAKQKQGRQKRFKISGLHATRGALAQHAQLQQDATSTPTKPKEKPSTQGRVCRTCKKPGHYAKSCKGPGTVPPLVDDDSDSNDPPANADGNANNGGQLHSIAAPISGCKRPAADDDDDSDDGGDDEDDEGDGDEEESDDE